MPNPRTVWSPAAACVWGKTADRSGEDWLPVVQHLLDAADVARLVWEWMPRRVRDLVESALPPGARDGRALLRWLAGVHDIGKCSPPFASKVPALAERMHERGLVLPRSTKEFPAAPHGLVGHVVLTRWLSERYTAERRVATSYAVVVGGHHGAPPSNRQVRYVRERPHLIGSGRWLEVQDEILDRMAEHTGVADLLPHWASTPLPVTAQAILSGAVIVSDWLASNAGYFPLDAQLGEARAAAAWDALSLPAPWEAEPPGDQPAEQLARRFPELSGATLRPVQQLTVDAAHSLQTPGLLIVEAAMGTGKTEAALLAAEVLAARFGCGGVYFALPTMATSDAMFARVTDWIGNLDGAGVMSTYLAHGKAGLNDDFRGLMRPAAMTSVHDTDDPNCDSHAEVLSWLSGRKKGVLANMVVGTIDQLLFAALQAKHVALRHLAFAGKVVVVDEVHAADDHMRTFLVRALEWLAAYGVPVVLLSATLPAGQRQELADGYRRGLGASPEPVPASAPYPAVTVISSTGIDLGSSPDEVVAPQPVVVRCLDDDLEALAGELENKLVDGGCVAVIRNTVGRAQETARFLEERFGADVVLHHSRFIATHRIRREAELRAELGRNGVRPPRRIVVGTQVLEQSLDVDFDLMVTDLAPVDLVLQRLGRLHRHARGEAGRPPLLRQPTLLVTGIDGWGDDGAPEPVGGSEVVYGASRLLRAAGVLGLSPDGTATIDLSTDIRDLVERAYGDTPPVPDAWLATVGVADRKQAEASAAQRAKATDFLLPGIDELDGSLMQWLGYGDASEAEDPRANGAGRVRDTQDGIEVIVVQRRKDGEVVFIGDGSEHAGRPVVPTIGPPGWDLARALAGTTVRFPLLMTASPADFDAVLDALEAQAHEGWQESPWLAGQLALHLDEDWRAQIAGFDVTYDLKHGLSAVRVPGPRSRNGPGT